MQILSLFRRKPSIDPALLMASALAVQSAMLALEGYLETTADRRGLAMTRKLHRALEAAFVAHAPALGVDLGPLSGGLPKPE